VGLALGKNDSAGRNRSSRTNKANRYLKSTLVGAAQVVGHKHDTHLAARGGKKRAAVAAACSILVIACHLIRRGTVYEDLGVNI